MTTTTTKRLRQTEDRLGIRRIPVPLMTQAEVVKFHRAMRETVGGEALVPLTKEAIARLYETRRSR
jgi:hypothetical protein